MVAVVKPLRRKKKAWQGSIILPKNEPYRRKSLVNLVTWANKTKRKTENEKKTEKNARRKKKKWRK